MGTKSLRHICGSPENDQLAFRRLGFLRAIKERLKTACYDLEAIIVPRCVSLEREEASIAGGCRQADVEHVGLALFYPNEFSEQSLSLWHYVVPQAMSALSEVPSWLIKQGRWEGHYNWYPNHDSKL